VRPLDTPLGPAQLVIAGQQIIRTCRVILRPDRERRNSHTPARCPPARIGGASSLDTVRDDLGDWTVSSALGEHSAYAGSAAGPRMISLHRPADPPRAKLVDLFMSGLNNSPRLRRRRRRARPLACSGGSAP